MIPSGNMMYGCCDVWIDCSHQWIMESQQSQKFKMPAKRLTNAHKRDKGKCILGFIYRGPAATTVNFWGEVKLKYQILDKEEQKVQQILFSLRWTPKRYPRSKETAWCSCLFPGEKWGRQADNLAWLNQINIHQEEELENLHRKVKQMEMDRETITMVKDEVGVTTQHSFLLLVSCTKLISKFV